MTSTRLILRVLIFTCGVFNAGCATMLNGRHQDVLVLSEPSGAAILLNGKAVGSTPTSVRMRRRGAAVLEIGKAGYTSANVPVGNSASLAVAGNLIFLNPLAAQGMNSTTEWATSAASWFIGTMSLDFWSGGAFKRPTVVTVTLDPVPPPDSAALPSQLGDDGSLGAGVTGAPLVVSRRQRP